MRLNISWQQLRKWHEDKVPAADVCRALGWSAQMYRSRMREALGLRGDDDPSIDEIRRQCEAISSEWSDDERRARMKRGGSAYQKLVERATRERSRANRGNGYGG